MQGLRLGSAACSAGIVQRQILSNGGQNAVRLGCKNVVFGLPSWDLGLQPTRAVSLLDGGSTGGRVKARATGRVAPAANASNTMELITADEKDELELLEPDFYRIGYVRHVRAYGIEFREGPDGIGVYSAKDLPYLEKPRVILEVPMEIMVTCRKDLPWMFFPDIVPMGHPIFEIINSTDPEKDWDVRMACLLLLALDTPDNFWQLYGDYLPSVDDSSSLLLASEEELLELQDSELAQRIRDLQQRAETTWEKHWPADSILKLKRLSREPGRFRWALATAMSRSFTMPMNVGTIVQDANMLIPYADMFNHSVQPTCSYRFRKKDRMLEVIINAGQEIKQGDEMTFNYLEQGTNTTFMERYGFSTAANPWDTLRFSGNSKIHLDSFLSAFQIAGMKDEYYYNETASEEVDPFIDGTIVAAARTLPTWEEKDLPYIPSTEIRSACELQHECQQLLDDFPTTLEDDTRLLNEQADVRSPRWKAAIKYRIDRKSFIKKIIQALDVYMERASNLLKAVLRPRALSAASRQRSVSEGTRERRSLSPDNRLPSSTLVSKKSPASAPVVKKTTCMCSPTNHPGSFRCRYHREMAAKSAAAAASIPRGRSPSPASPSFKRSQSEMLNSVVFSEVNRTLPGCASRTSRSPTGRTSRLQKMTMSTGFEEEDEIMCLIANDVLRSPKASPSIRGLPSSDGTRSSAFSFKAAAEIEIPTMFCQSTSTVATDIFSRSMSRMYL